MLNNFEYIQKLYTVIKTQKRLNNEYAIIFVYNSPETMNDTKHSYESFLLFLRGIIKELIANSA